MLVNDEYFNLRFTRYIEVYYWLQNIELCNKNYLCRNWEARNITRPHFPELKIVGIKNSSHNTFQIVNASKLKEQIYKRGLNV